MHSLTALCHLHLKYCERCSRLWLRPDGSASPYCPACASFVAMLPRRNRRKAVRRAPAPATAVSAAVSTLALILGWWL